MRTRASILLSSILVVILTSCGGSQKSDNESSSDLKGTIKIDGSSTVYPITEAVAEEFRTEAPRVNVTVGVSGTGGGFKKFSVGKQTCLMRPGLSNKKKKMLVLKTASPIWNCQ